MFLSWALISPAGRPVWCWGDVTQHLSGCSPRLSADRTHNHKKLSNCHKEYSDLGRIIRLANQQAGSAVVMLHSELKPPSQQTRWLVYKMKLALTVAHFGLLDWALNAFDIHYQRWGRTRISPAINDLQSFPACSAARPGFRYSAAWLASQDN